MDRDGDLDAAILHSDGEHWHANTDGAGGTWGAQTSAGGGGCGGKHIIADVDRDGDPDVLRSSCYLEGYYWNRNNGAATSWTDCAVFGGFNSPSYFAMGDIDGDGDLDLIGQGTDAGTNIPQLIWAANTGVCGGWTGTVIATGGSFGGVAVGDVDGDGDADVVSKNINGLRVYRNTTPGTATWPIAATIATGVSPNELTLADMDLDGDLDVVAAHNSVAGWYENNTGLGTTWTARTTSLPNNRGYSAVGDLSGDGRPDIAASSNNAYVVFPMAAQQVSLSATSTAPSSIEEPDDDDLIKLTVAHTFGRTGDVDIELAYVDLFLHDGFGVALDDSEVDGLLDAIEIWRDDGDGSFAAATDGLAASVSDFSSMAGGYLSIELVDGDPTAAVSFGQTQRFFVVVDLAVNASQNGTIAQLGVDWEPYPVFPLEHAGTEVPIVLDGTPAGISTVIDIEPLDSDDDGSADYLDCDDGDDTIYPLAPESCDSIDSDCDGSIVDSFTDTDSDLTPDCVDLDDDGDLDPDSTDCADTDPTRYGGAVESCDSIDQDCDGSLVDGFANFDGDSEPDCIDLNDDNDPVPDATDCNDANAAIYPGATESCDNVDSNCDGSLVDGFANFDNDLQPDCVDANDDNDPSPDTADCDDNNASIYPNATESCDAVDSDCDGSLIDGFANFDGDTLPDCADPDDDNDLDPDATDCADTDSAIYTGATELCDAVDQDCDGSLVDQFTDADSDLEPDCTDVDDDGDGDADGSDCEPLDGTIFDGAVEACDLVDQDCDGSLVDAFDDTDADLLPDCVDPDDDADGLPDGWEDANALDPLDADDAAADPDGDGRDNLTEYQQGHDPNVSDLPDAPTALRPGGGAFEPTLRPEFVVEPATSPVGDTLTYRFEAYADLALTQLIATAEDVAEVEPETGWTADVDLPEDGAVYWRAAAWDGYGQGPWSDVLDFVVDSVGGSPAVPVPSFPVTGQTMDVGEETLRWGDSESPENLPVSYDVEVRDATGTNLLAADTFAGEDGNAEEAWDVPITLTSGTNYLWRVRARDPAGRVSAFCEDQVFGYDRANLAPAALSWVAPRDGDELVDRSPTLEVEGGDDPEGGVVTFTFFLDSIDSFDSPDARTWERGGDDLIVDLATEGVSLEETGWFARVDAVDPDGNLTASDTIAFFVRGDNDPPPTPTPIAPEPNLVTGDVPEFTVSSVDDPEGDVVTYEFAVWASDGSRSAPAATGTSEAPSWVPDDPLSGGYYWSARAVDAAGAASAWSGAQWFVAFDRRWAAGTCSQGGAAGAAPLGAALLFALRRRRR